jgi:hypothetical protein
MALGPTRLNLAEKISSYKAVGHPGVWGDIHWGILQHIWDNEKADHAPSNIDLIKLGDAAISASYCDILQGNVEIIFRCKERISTKKKYHEDERPSASFPR